MHDLPEDYQAIFDNFTSRLDGFFQQIEMEDFVYIQNNRINVKSEVISEVSKLLLETLPLQELLGEHQDAFLDHALVYIKERSDAKGSKIVFIRNYLLVYLLQLLFSEKYIIKFILNELPNDPSLVLKLIQTFDFIHGHPEIIKMLYIQSIGVSTDIRWYLLDLMKGVSVESFEELILIEPEDNLRIRIQNLVRGQNGRNP